MSPRERLVLATILTLITVMAGTDLATDSREGVLGWHLVIESTVGLMAVAGLFYLLQDALRLRKALANEQTNFAAYKIQAEEWRSESRKYVEGLAKAIDQQLNKWSLSTAEKEVAFLLLKGLSLKEIAQVRQTTEKTARVQSMAIYSKSGVGNRAELSAFFLEDLLVPDKGADPS